jgi:hypothetical protein
MYPQTANGSPWASLIPIVLAMGLVILRNSRARRLRIEAMWIAPLMVVALIGLALWGESKTGRGGLVLTPVNIGLDVAGIVIGAFLGWWRARFTNITIDPATHELTSRASPLGMVVIMGILVLRTLVRTYTAENAGALGQWGPPIADALLVMSVGLVCAQRLELFTRASRMLAEARANAPPQSAG